MIQVMPPEGRDALQPAFEVPYGYQFAPNCSRVVVVLSSAGGSRFSPPTLMLPILPTPTLSPPSSASLGDTKYCTPPLAPTARPERERSACCPVSKLSIVVVRRRRPSHAPT